jgi:hypothetical protein
MTKNKQRKINIKPLKFAKALIIAYALFLSLFALDTPFGTGFFIQLLPSFIFLGTLLIFWKKPKIAGILFVIEGIGTIIVWNTYRDLFVFAAISLVPILIGLLFFLSKNPKH